MDFPVRSSREKREKSVRKSNERKKKQRQQQWEICKIIGYATNCEEKSEKVKTLQRNDSVWAENIPFFETVFIEFLQPMLFLFRLQFIVSDPKQNQKKSFYFRFILNEWTQFAQNWRWSLTIFPRIQFVFIETIFDPYSVLNTLFFFVYFGSSGFCCLFFSFYLTFTFLSTPVLSSP